MIPLSAETLFSIGSFPVTNTVLATLVTDAVILGGVFCVYRRMAAVPGILQNIAEMVIDYFHSLTESVAGERAKSIFPWFAGFFLFIVTANLLALLPGYGLIGIHEGEELIPLLRAPTSDLNATLALAVISVVTTHYLSIHYLGLKNYLKRFFSINFILLFVGMLELISEFTKVISFSFRLFGNIYAGEVLLGTIATLYPWSKFLVPLPFLCLELVVAVLQAFIFAMLTMVFMSILTTSHEGGH